MSQQNGIPVNFSLSAHSGDHGMTSTGGFVFDGHLMQGVDYETGADKEQVRASGGGVVSENYYDDHDKGTFRAVIAAASKAAAVTATTLAACRPGAFLVIVQCDSHPYLIGTNWVIQAGAKITGDVTKSAELTIPAEKRAAITAVQA